MRLPRLFVAIPFLALMACASSPRIHTVRVGALVPAKTTCTAKHREMDVAVAMDRYQHLGMLTVMGESTLSPKLKEQLRTEACELGGDFVVFNASVPAAGGMLQFVVFRERPEGEDFVSPSQALADRIATAMKARGAPPEKKIPTGAVVAVLDIEDPDRVIEPDANQALSDSLSMQLAESKRFRVLPSKMLRTELTSIAAESYLVSHDERTQRKLGQAVSAEKTLATRLFRADDQCAISAVLFDVEQQVSESAATTMSGCKLGNLMSSLQRLVAKLAGE